MLFDGLSQATARRDSAGQDAGSLMVEDGEWYWVLAYYKAVHRNLDPTGPLWQKLVFLVRAIGEAEAVGAAEAIAREKEHEYTVATGETVRWVLERVAEVQPLFDAVVQSGTEVYWEFFETGSGAGLEQSEVPGG